MASAPTRRVSRLPAQFSDKMSRKSGFTDGLPHKGPGVEGERPRHGDSFRGRGADKVGLLPLIFEPRDAHHGASSGAAGIVFGLLAHPTDSPVSAELRRHRP
jgi:hypothetical protein